MTLSEHLRELRKRLIICIVAFIVAATFATFAYQPILSFLLHPLCQVDTSKSLGLSQSHSCRLYVTSPLDGLSLRVKIALFGGFFLSSPIWFFEAWRFITPGMRASEKRYAIPFVTATFALFLLGCLTAYITLPHALGFLSAVGGPELTQIYDPIPYLGLIILMMVLFGLTFEFPVVLVSLQLARIVSSRQLLRAWRWAVIGITFCAAVFTPSSDPFSMLALAIPLVVFYFMSIVVGKLLGR